MQVLRRPKLTLLMGTLALVAVIALPFAVSAAPLHSQRTASATASHAHINCAAGNYICAEVNDSEQVFGEGHYVGHDEPSTEFFSNVPGSGNRMRYDLILPKDPSPSNPLTPGKSYNFQLHPAFWFGFAMCDTQSYPEQVSTCTPDSDKNIVDPTVSLNHPGTAFMELQFYPPGWVPQFASQSCDATKWCSALTIDSVSENPVTGQTLNDTCAAVTGLEYVNFAYVTKNGIPQAVPNPVQFNAADQTPDPHKVLFMNQGDHIVITMHDTAHGLRTDLQDLTTGGSGFMTASAANGFGQVKFAPNPSTECTNIPYDFHPMYSTSSEKTRTIWAAAAGNVAFSDELGHFDLCDNVDTTTGTCAGKEGQTNDQEPADADDSSCFPASASLLVQVSGCNGQNDGFDGMSYQQVWPDGNTKMHPTPIQFSSPLTGENYNVNYNRSGFEVDLPDTESHSVAANCNRSTGIGCNLIPQTDDGQPAVFYPFFSITNVGGQCFWQFGNHIPGSRNDFGQNTQYGRLLQLTYIALGGGGALVTRYNDFQQILSKNPCNA